MGWLENLQTNVWQQYVPKPVRTAVKYTNPFGAAYTSTQGIANAFYGRAKAASPVTSRTAAKTTGLTNETSGNTTPYSLGNAASNAAASEMAKTKKMWEQLYRDGLVDYDEMQSAINANRMNISSQLSAIAKGAGSKRKALGAQLDSTLQGQRSFFNAVSPEAYQSQQGDYAGRAKKVYNEAIAEVNAEEAANKAIQAQAMAQTNAQQKRADDYRGALETYRNEGGVEPSGAPSIGQISPKYQNRDLSKYYTKLSNLYLANTLGGMTQEQNKINIRKAMNKEGLEPELQDFLYQQIFPEDFVKTNYPSASDYSMLNEM